MTSANPVALVTGGVGGVGQAVGRRLRSQGYEVVLAALDSAAGPRIAESLGCSFLRLDVTDLEAYRVAIDTIERVHGRLDLVHLNAGITAGWGTASEVPMSKYHQVVDVNVHGVVYGVIAAAPALARSGGGAVVVTASMAGLATSRDPYYALAKAAVIGYVRSIAAQLAEDNITINAVCPSFVDTPLVSGELRESGYPMLTADDVASAVTKSVETGDTGEAWLIQVGHEPQPYKFRGVPGARLADGTVAQPKFRDTTPA